MTSKTKHRPPTAELPAQAISANVLRDKYAKGDEKTIDDLFRRVARALGRERDTLAFDYAGLNHLGWLKGVRDRDGDLLGGLLDERFGE